jgi:hypothetical protein
MPSNTVSSLASAGAGLAAGAAFGGPAGAAVGAGVGALMGALNKIGQGRKTANLMTQGGPQDILNQQLKAIVADPGTNAQEKAQATQAVWSSFLTQANQFAQTNGGKAPTVVQQAIYKTPGLTNTVNTLLAPLGQTAFDQSYTNLVPGISATGINKAANPGLGGGQGPGGNALETGLIAGGVGAGAGLAGGYFFSGNGGSSSVGDVANTGIDYPGATTTNADGEIVPAGSTGGPVFDENGDIIPGAEGGIPSAAGGGGAPTGSTSANTNSILQSIFKKNPSLLSTLIGSGTSLLGGLIGSNAAQNAATTQSNAALAAAQLEAQAGQNSLDFEKQVFNQQQTNLQPWINAGSNALNSIAQINANPYTLPTVDQAMQAPGLQFQLQLGQQALEAYERANGTLQSGKAMKDIDSYAQGVAQQGYGNLVNEQLAARSANLNPLLSVAGLGQTSTSNLNTNIGNTGNTIANIGTTTAQNVGQTQQQAAQAQASGYVGSSNSWLSALGNIGNNLQGTQTIQALLAALQPKQPAYAGA